MHWFGQLTTWIRRFRQRRPLFTRVEGLDGSIMLVDQATLDYMASTTPTPTQASLDTMLTKTRRVRLLDGGAAGGEPLSHKILYDTTDPAALQALAAALRIREEPSGHCMCHGDVALEFLGPSRERLAVIGVHHGVSIRWNHWRDDAALVDGIRLLEWLAAHDVTAPLDAYREAQEQQREAKRAWDRWVHAAPECLAQYLTSPSDEAWLDFLPARPADSWQSERAREAIELIERAYPNPTDRALVLLRWFGSGVGPWSGFPVYEHVVEQLLMPIALTHLLEALENPRLDDVQLEGAARFLAGWDFRTHRGADLDQIPPHLRARLLAHVAPSSDRDKQQRARSAFGS